MCYKSRTATIYATGLDVKSHQEKKSQRVQNTRSESLYDYVPTGKATTGISFKKTPQNQPMSNFLRPMVALAEESSGRRARYRDVLLSFCLCLLSACPSGSAVGPPQTSRQGRFHSGGSSSLCRLTAPWPCHNTAAFQ